MDLDAIAEEAPREPKDEAGGTLVTVLVALVANGPSSRGTTSSRTRS